MIPGILDFGETMSLRIDLRRGSKKEVLSKGLDMAVIEADNRWRKKDTGRGGREGLSMIATYTQVENSLGI